jgi:hypothetical protein
MTALELIQEAGRRGLMLRPSGDSLHVIPGRLCPPDFADLLRARKTELLALLADTNTDSVSEVVKPHRPLTEGEWAILVRAGAENDPVIIEALKLFNGRIVE